MKKQSKLKLFCILEVLIIKSISFIFAIVILGSLSIAVGWLALTLAVHYVVRRFFQRFVNQTEKESKNV